jgi:tetratricopeptide (TPR) repeat protein
MKGLAILILFASVPYLFADTIPEKVQKGMSFLNGGNLDAAAQVLQEVIQENPQHGPARFILAQIAMERSQWKEAEEHLKIASVSSNTRRPDLVWQLYGKLHLLQHNYPEARQSFEQSIQQSPSFIPAYIGRAQSELFLNDSAAALKDLERASGELPEAALLLAETLIYLNQDDRAKNHLTNFPAGEASHQTTAKLLLYSIQKDAPSKMELRRLVSANLGQSESYLALGISELRNNNTENAASLLQVAFELNDQNPIPFLLLKQIGKSVKEFKIPHAEILKKVALTQDALNQQKRDQADVLADEILRDRPMHIQVRLLLIEAAEKEKQYWDALSHYTKILESVRGLSPVEARFALLAQKMEAHDLAECHARKALQIEPDNGYLHHILATVLKSKGNLEGALAEAERGIALGFQEPSAYLVLGDIYYEQMEISKSIAALGKAVEMDPRAAEKIASFALFALTTDDTAALRNILEKHAQANPQSIETLYSLAILHSNENDLNRAKEYFSIVEKLAPDQSEIYYNLALVNLRLGLEQEGTKAMARFQELKKKEQEDWLNHNNAHRIRIDARNAVQNRNTNQAILLYSQLTTGSLAETADWIGLGNAYQVAGKQKDAFQAFEKALEHSPYNPDALTGAAKTAKALGNTQIADLYMERIRLLTAGCN